MLKSSCEGELMVEIDDRRSYIVNEGGGLREGRRFLLVWNRSFLQLLVHCKLFFSSHCQNTHMNTSGSSIDYRTFYYLKNLLCAIFVSVFLLSDDLEVLIKGIEVW